MHNKKSIIRDRLLMHFTTSTKAVSLPCRLVEYGCPEWQFGAESFDVGMTCTKWFVA